METFDPILKSPTSFAFPVSGEQKEFIHEILETACSDSRFVEKAERAITLVLTSGPAEPVSPSNIVISSLVPNTAEIGDANFTLHVKGGGFTSASVINFAGNDEPTTLVSAREVTTGVNMAVWLGADTLPVYVKDGTKVSNSVMFTFVTPSLSTLSTKSILVKKDEKK